MRELVKKLVESKQSAPQPAASVQVVPEPALFPRLKNVAGSLERLSRRVFEPANRGQAERIRMLEAKVEYLLNETYRLKSIQRMSPDAVEVLSTLRAYQQSTFDYQWTEIVYHDEFLSNPAWKEIAPQDVSDRIEVSQDWFKGKKILDCGCGPGRHTWAFATLGASVTAFDTADKTLATTRKMVAGFPNVLVEKRSVIEPLPYSNDFDLVWSYGVIHITGDTIRALKNIAQHVKPGGRLYFMVYAEPRRDNIFDYQYYHEVATIREATRGLSFPEKSKVYEQIEGPTQTLAWFDAISSEINDLYTFEELADHLKAMGFVDIKRTMPHETMHNVTATRAP